MRPGSLPCRLRLPGNGRGAERQGLQIHVLKLCGQIFFNGGFQHVRPGCDRSPEERARTWAMLGYDYAFLPAGLRFTYGPETRAASISLNESPLINSWEDFEKYPWPNVDDFDYSLYATVKLPPGMKLIAWGPNGILENLIRLVGFDREIGGDYAHHRPV